MNDRYLQFRNNQKDDDGCSSYIIPHRIRYLEVDGFVMKYYSRFIRS